MSQTAQTPDTPLPSPSWAASADAFASRHSFAALMAVILLVGMFALGWGAIQVAGPAVNRIADSNEKAAQASILMSERLVKVAETLTTAREQSRGEHKEILDAAREARDQAKGARESAERTEALTTRLINDLEATPARRR